MPCPLPAAAVDRLSSLDQRVLHHLLSFVPDHTFFFRIPSLSHSLRHTFSSPDLHRLYGQTRFGLNSTQWRRFADQLWPKLTVPVWRYDPDFEWEDAMDDGRAKDWYEESVHLYQQLHFATLYLSRYARNVVSSDPHGARIRYRLPSIVVALIVDCLTGPVVSEVRARPPYYFTSTRLSVFGLCRGDAMTGGRGPWNICEGWCRLLDLDYSAFLPRTSATDPVTIAFPPVDPHHPLPALRPAPPLTEPCEVDADEAEAAAVEMAERAVRLGESLDRATTNAVEPGVFSHYLHRRVYHHQDMTAMALQEVIPLGSVNVTVHDEYSHGFIHGLWYTLSHITAPASLPCLHLLSPQALPLSVC